MFGFLEKQQLLSGLVILLGLLYFWPGGFFLETLQFRVLGWPFFALWVVVLAPVLGIILFYLKSRIKNSEEEIDGI